MMKELRQLYYSSAAGRFLLGLPRKLHRFYRFRLMPEKTFIQSRFKRVFGRAADLDNPKTLNEKTQWLKLHDRTPLHTQCADKYAVREYVAGKVGKQYLIPLLYHTEDPADIRPENLPEPPFVVKTNHAGSIGMTFVRDKSGTDRPLVRKTLNKQIKQNYYHARKEWQYKNIKPRIIVERMLSTRDGGVPFDYKLHCFHGEPKVIQVDLGRFTDHKRNLYDTEWNLLPFTWCLWRNGQPLWPNGRDVSPPSRLQEMLQIAQRLSAPFMYARIDLYEVEGSVFFGEITFHHGSGTEIFTPPEWDRRLGDMLILPGEKKTAEDDG